MIKIKDQLLFSIDRYSEKEKKKKLEKIARIILYIHICVCTYSLRSCELILRWGQYNDDAYIA